MGRERFYLVVKTVILLHEEILQDLFVAFAKIYSVHCLLNLRAVLKARDRSHVLPTDDSEGCDAQRDTSLGEDRACGVPRLHIVSKLECSGTKAE